MVATTESVEKRAHNRAWVILFVIGVLLSLNSLVFAVLGTTPAVFEEDTGIRWAEFSGSYPSVAIAYDLIERLVGTGFFGIALFATLAAFFGYRKGERWAWYALWTLPLTLAMAVLWFFKAGRPDLAGYYIVVVVITLLGLLLPARKFFPEGG